MKSIIEEIKDCKKIKDAVEKAFKLAYGVPGFQINIYNDLSVSQPKVPKAPPPKNKKRRKRKNKFPVLLTVQGYELKDLGLVQEKKYFDSSTGAWELPINGYDKNKEKEINGGNYNEVRPYLNKHIQKSIREIYIKLMLGH